MKKLTSKLTVLLTTVLLAASATAFVACSDDGNKSEDRVRLVASYKGIVAEPNTRAYFYFYSDGSFKYTDGRQKSAEVYEAKGTYTGDPAIEGTLNLSVTSESPYVGDETILSEPKSATMDINSASVNVFSLVATTSYPSDASAVVFAKSNSDYAAINGKTYKSSDEKYTVSFSTSQYNALWSLTTTLIAPRLTTTYASITESDTEKTTTSHTSEFYPFGTSEARVIFYTYSTTDRSLYYFTLNADASTLTLTKIYANDTNQLEKSVTLTVQN